MNKQLEIFVTCFYVWTEIGLRTLSLAFFFGVGLDWIFISKYWTGLGVEKISVRSSLIRIPQGKKVPRNPFASSPSTSIFISFQQFKYRSGELKQFYLSSSSFEFRKNSFLSSSSSTSSSSQPWFRCKNVINNKLLAGWATFCKMWLCQKC